jgi:hypothetical protein
MNHEAISAGEEYAYREYPQRRCSPLFRIEIIDKAKSGKWKTKFLERGPSRFFSCGSGDTARSVD